MAGTAQTRESQNGTWLRAPVDAPGRVRQVIPVSQPAGAVHHLSPPESKIALFRSLFRGRDDVYPRRFENRKTGKSGYAPACGNE
jgi:hypothetical protein